MSTQSRKQKVASLSVSCRQSSPWESSVPQMWWKWQSVLSLPIQNSGQWTGQQHECSGLHGSPSEFFGFVFFCLCNLFFPLLYSILEANVLLVEPGIHIHPNFVLFFCQLYFPNQTGQGSSGSKEAQVHLRK